MLHSDIQLARRLERAEGQACIEFVEVRQRLSPQSSAEWIVCGGAYAAFDGTDSPITQTFGLGLFEDLCPATPDAIERFFFDRGAAAVQDRVPRNAPQEREVIESHSILFSRFCRGRSKSQGGGKNGFHGSC